MGYLINSDNYKTKKQPAKSEELINIVQVSNSPLEFDVLNFEDRLFKSGTPLDFAIAESKTIEIVFSDIPVKNPEANAYITLEEGELTCNSSGEISNTGFNISTKTYYAWGASLSMTNLTGSQKYVVVVVSGYPLIVIGDEKIEARDEDGIIENGILIHKLKENHLIQNRELAQSIADTLLSSFSTPRKDISLDWRGCLDLNLNNEITVPEYDKKGIYTEGDFYIYKQSSSYDGTYKQKTDGRKI